MKRPLLCYTLLLVIILTACKKDELHAPLPVTDNLSFSGTFKSIHSETIAGSVSLNISKGHYDCWTNFPYGHGAGKVETSNSTINFIDTLFIPVPAIYGPSYILSGKYHYEFDGKNLKLKTANRMSTIAYHLTLSDCENAHYGILKNLTGLDGCAWVIQLSDSIRLEPINIEAFNIELIENKSVCVQFRERADLGSYCMVGKVVELDFIE